MHQYRGRLIVHTGSMFSGKTSSLEKDINRFAIAGYRTVAFRPSIDVRSEKEAITTHDNISVSAVCIDTIYDILEYLKDKNFQIIGIDEVQFLGGELEDIIEGIDDLLAEGKTVVVAGLDMDYTGRPFDVVKELMPRCDYLTKHHAVCTKCGVDAWISHKLTDSDNRIDIGASEKYEPLCRRCYLQMLGNSKIKRGTKNAKIK